MKPKDKIIKFKKISLKAPPTKEEAKAEAIKDQMFVTEDGDSVLLGHGKEKDIFKFNTKQAVALGLLLIITAKNITTKEGK